MHAAAAGGSINSCQSTKQLNGTTTETYAVVLKFDLHFLETLVGEGGPITIYNNHVLKLESIAQ